MVKKLAMKRWHRRWEAVVVAAVVVVAVTRQSRFIDDV
jgi:hypothetical protein